MEFNSANKGVAGVMVSPVRGLAAGRQKAILGALIGDLVSPAMNLTYEDHGGKCRA